MSNKKIYTVYRPKPADIEVTIHGPKTYGSALSNYSEAYEAWDEEETVECPQCFGTGLDRDEVYDCENCFGEGVIVDVNSALNN